MFDVNKNSNKPIPKKLIAYGFKNIDELYIYRTDISNGEFELTVQIDMNGRVDTHLVEKETGEAYTLYKTDASGTYIGRIRDEIDQTLSDIFKECFETSVFKMPQTQRVIKFIRESYGDELEFLWPASPHNAVWRRKDSQKWYGAVLTVQGNKIGLETENTEEIIDLRMNPAEAEAVLSRANYYPGWHMNKKSWFTLVLDGSVTDEELKIRIAESYELAGK
ncbi:MAG: MmcQ/YjbR family DNA-binding protein [Ruminococcus sp.]